MLAPYGALKAAAKILKVPVVKIKRGHYRIDVVKADKISYETWLAANKASNDWLRARLASGKATMHGGCETGYKKSGA